ncbi:hypothetical protein D9M69_606320 [compost metagenome]
MRRWARASQTVAWASNSVTRATPMAASDAAMAQPTPPLPTTSTRAPCSFSPLRCTPRTKPEPSNMSPIRRPSGSRFTALQAPATFTVGVTTSTRSTVTTLWGMVMSAPRMLVSLNAARRNAG